MGRKIVWSPTRISMANSCGMRYFLRYMAKEPSLRFSVYAKGSVLHSLIENFWSKLAKPGEQVSRTGKGPRYSNSDEFADYAKRMWQRTCIMSENSDHPISWRFEDEQWFMANDIRDICYPLFPVLLEEDRPVFSEPRFKFAAFGKLFGGRIDHGRMEDGEIVVRDYKSGSPFMGKMKLSHDPQLTIYNAALVARVRENPELAREYGLERLTQEDSENPVYVDPSLKLEYFMIEAPKKNQERAEMGREPLPIIQSTTRSNKDFFEIVDMIDRIEENMRTGNVSFEWGDKCNYCDMKVACEKKAEEVDQGPFTDRRDQLFLDFAVPSFAKQAKDKKQKKDPRQKHFPWRYNKPSPD